MTGFSLKEIANRFRSGIYQSSEVDSALALKTNSADLVSAIGNINSPLLDMPLKNNLAMKAGVGSATFTRASTATYIDRYGVLKTAAVDEPRFEKEGYLNEGASTNLLTYSELFSDSSWIKSNTTVTAGQSDPMGGTNAFMWNETTAISTSYVYKIITFTAQSYSASLFVKKGTASEIFIWFNDALFSAGQQAYIRFNFDTKVITDVKNSVTSEKVEELANGWFRVSFSFTVVNAQTSSGFVTGAATETNNTGNTFYIFGAQLEALPFATSYIPTTSATATRSADVLAVTATGNINESTTGDTTIVVDFKPLALSTLGSFGIIVASSLNTDAMIAQVDTTIRQKFGLASKVIVTMDSTDKMRLATSYKSSRATGVSCGYLNGVSTGSYQETTSPVKTGYNKIGIGYNSVSSNSWCNGNISNLRIYDKALTAQEVALA